ncbi:hypothetical protein NSK_006769 [Nannochloropsis salina CCMP1776]|uniref:V-type proton ATPase subunit a n=1 Tax=Nannochloropsis salina CCMP1776 TaxID=1027361 RepID=A0A4D9CU34_9STRA|nr:hypothetical protein NSK_006769 [Nannochloropsis salina CCMP1776]|eukprot:TFJ82104.1 hypothetical protein NSK_006769 [Nannochloropsis salina CCMP1776]
MAKWFRSEEMEYVSLIVNEDAAHGAVNDLGMLGIIQFTDLNHEQTAFQRRYISYIKRCDELERKLRYMRTEIAKFGLDTEVPGGYQKFFGRVPGGRQGPPIRCLCARAARKQA